ncbi:MAG: pyruvate, phosphate dikinase, partial [Salinivirgaceae bacterium]|nr:pyruvate, phosphate dikinase [Salinivirgaceae bacterium]
HLASVYNADNDTVRPGTDGYGPRVLNFADILQYNYFPLAETIDTILATVRDAFGSPVEIEYAVNLTPGLDGKPSFYLLQIKPLVGANTIETDCNIFEQKERLWLYTQQSLGNGTLNDIEDVIYIDNEKFNKLETIEMAEEINRLNTMMIEEGRKYILIGPGRWGSSDRFLGVPVDWSQISNARVIVEIGLNDYPLDFSLGSHFFHNVTSMNIGYFAVQNHSAKSFIRWEVLDNQETIHATKHFRHIRFNHPVTVVMDGKEKVAGICVD